MSFNLWTRRVHYWAAMITAIPLLMVIGSGLLLQSKKHWSWVQPAEQRGTGTVPAVDLEAILASVKQVGEVNVQGWDDVNRLDVRPGRGLVKVWLKNGWEVQVDLGTGRVLQRSYRRSDLIESIHDGSWLAGDWTKLGLFVPAGVALLVLWCTGIWMWLLPFRARRARTAQQRAAEELTHAARQAPGLTD